MIFALFIFLGITSLSGPSTSWSSSHSQLSINTQLPVINNALQFLNQSPIDNEKLSNQKYLEQKILNVNTYLLTAFGLEQKTDDQILTQEFLDTIEHLKKNFTIKRLLKKKKFKFSLYCYQIGAFIKFVILWKLQRILSKSRSL